MEYRDNWLPHLKNTIPNRARGNNLSMYSIALEGWRRGLMLKFYTAYHDGRFEVQYSLSNEIKEHKFEISKGDLNDQKAKEICTDKIISKNILQRQGIPVPKGKSFSAGEKDEMVKFAEVIEYPVVVKPTDGKLGRGVFTNIESESLLLKAIDYITKDLQYKNIILEKHVEGNDFRFYVIGDYVISAVQRVPANIKGDGVHTIDQLIDMKNQERKNNPNTATRLIKKDREVKQAIENQGLTLDSVLDSGQRIFLRGKSNISSGGESIDKTNLIPNDIKNLAVRAVKAIPGLIQAGVDIIIDSNMEKAEIIEINTRPGIGLHLFPSSGMAVDVPKAIIEYYFPDTIKKKINPNIYFDFGKIYDILKTGVLEEVVVAPTEEEYEIAYFEAYGNVQTKRFHNWLMKNTLNLRLNGNARYLSNGNVLITVQGTKKYISRFNELLKRQVPLKQNVQIEQNVNSMKVGFEIIDK